MKCCDLTSSKLRNSIAIQRETSTTDSVGGLVNTWATLTTVYAYIKPVSGSESVYSSRIDSSITHKIYIRYLATVSPKQRVNYNGRLMNIKSVLNLEERNKWLELHCVEGVES
jgi:SPP1 family predicted phage head-tail adaptor